MLKKTTVGAAAVLVGLFTLSTLACEKIFAQNQSPAQQSAQGVKRYQIKSAIVEYALSGMQSGTETLYFIDYGMREAKYTNTELKMGGITQKSNNMTLLEGATIYTIDLDTKTGTKMENPLYKSFEGKDATEAGEKILTDMGGKKIGTENLLGKTCDIWEIKNLSSKTWIWSGLPLKTETNMMGMQMTIAATKIQEGAVIPNEKLQIPPGTKITEGTAPMKTLEKLNRSPVKN